MRAQSQTQVESHSSQAIFTVILSCVLIFEKFLGNSIEGDGTWGRLTKEREIVMEGGSVQPEATRFCYLVLVCFAFFIFYFGTMCCYAQGLFFLYVDIF